MISPRVPQGEASNGMAPAPEDRDTLLAQLRNANGGSRLARPLNKEGRKAEIRFERECYQEVLAEERAGLWTPPVPQGSMREQLAAPRTKPKCAIEEVHPWGGNGLILAPKFTGKTTLSVSLFRSLVDDEPFLGKFKINFSGNVGFFSYEMPEGLMNDWIEEASIENLDGLYVQHLRNASLPLQTEEAQEWVVNWLIERAIKTWVVDSFGAAFSGFGNEDSNTDIRRFVMLLDQIKGRAGVQELFILAHPGWGNADRFRGGITLEDWADTKMVLSKDTNEKRFIQFAKNRTDGDSDTKFPLAYDPETRRVTIEESFDEIATQASTAGLGGKIATFRDKLKAHPHSVEGVSQRERARLFGVSQSTISRAFTDHKAEFDPILEENYKKPRGFLEETN